MLVRFWLATSNAAQQELFRNANQRRAAKQFAISAQHHFVLAPGDPPPPAAVPARIIIIKAPEQLEHIGRKRLVRRRIIVFDCLPDPGQHHVSEVGRWPIAALGFHDGLIHLLFEAPPPILSAGAIRTLTGRFWYCSAPDGPMNLRA
jgi:hypothetical protein